MVKNHNNKKINKNIVTKITNIFDFSSQKKIGHDFLGHFTWNHP